MIRPKGKGSDDKSSGLDPDDRPCWVRPGTVGLDYRLAIK